MNYNTTLYTHPIPFAADTTTEFRVPVGDSYFITLRESDAPEINFSPARNDIHIDDVIRNTLYIADQHHGVASVVTEGQVITITVKCSDTAPQDVTFDWNITHGGVFLNGELSNPKATLGNFDYSTLHRDSVDTDYGLLTGQATILQGDTEVEITIPTVDDLLWTGGVNTFKVSTFTISNVNDPMMLMDRMQSLIMLEDNTATPVYEGTVQLWVRMGEEADCHLEPLGGRTDAVTFDIGYDESNDSLLETAIFDDVDIRTIAFKTLIDPIAPNGEDATNATFYYKAQIKSGRRNA